ncbi:uracil-DNA glycosylase [Actinotalea sp. BY-33]|uniref:Type-5 uracil-DNA glycosylase n=1 Tax=Actinotalea soli TaxID=2819234 RepID=A0A939RV23_9CELL|nr:uracil-DNA glycosylase [Actinotalea soli]MBO1751960.1 uracil-DNA glycosylase [Actinotalea soli]
MDGRVLLPHPRTRELFDSPVPAGSGWPGEPADGTTPVATSARDVARIADASGEIPQVDAASTVCRACPRLVSWREEVAVTRRRAFRDQPYWGRPAAGFGDPQAGLLVVGLAPAAHGANRTGRLFTGDRSGDWLFAALHRAGVGSQAESLDAADGLTLDGVRMAAAVRCAPPENKPTPAERDTCAPWLRREIELMPRLRVMLALGAFGWQAALAVVRGIGWEVPRPAPRFGHGATAVLTRPDGERVHLLGCYHVSQQNTQTGRLTEAMLDDLLAQALALARP